MLFGGVDEVDSAEHIAVVGHGDSGHTLLLDAAAELFDVGGAVEHGVVGVEVEVYEVGHCLLIL
jgi:hypothetical protein